MYRGSKTIILMCFHHGNITKIIYYSSVQTQECTPLVTLFVQHMNLNLKPICTHRQYVYVIVVSPIQTLFNGTRAHSCSLACKSISQEL